MGNCEVITKVDIGSDHRMVRAKVEIKVNEPEENSKTNSLKLDLSMLEKLATPFRIELKNRFDTLKDEEPSVEKMSKILRESMNTIQNKTQKSTTKKSIENTEIESLDKRRKNYDKSKQNTKILGRICRTQQITEKETLNKNMEEKKGINTRNIRSKKGSKTDQ